MTTVLYPDVITIYGEVFGVQSKLNEVRSSEHSYPSSSEKEDYEKALQRVYQVVKNDLDIICSTLDKGGDIPVKNSLIAFLNALMKVATNPSDDTKSSFGVSLREATEAFRRTQCFEHKVIACNIRIMSVLHMFNYFDAQKRNMHEISEACRGPWNDFINLSEVRGAIRDEFESTGIFSFRKIGKSRSNRYGILCAVSDMKRNIESILNQNLYLRDSNGEALEFMGHNTTVFQGHASNISVLTMNLKEGFLVSGSLDNEVKVWDIDSLSLLTVLHGPMNGVYALAHSEDYLFAGAGDNNIWIWHKLTRASIDSVAQLRVLKAHTDTVYSLVISNGLLFSGSGDHDILIWDIHIPIPKDQPMAPILMCRGHNNSICAMITHGSRLYSGSWDSDIKVWDLSSLEHHQSKYLLNESSSSKSTSSNGTFVSTTTSATTMSTSPVTYPIVSVDTDSGRIYSMAFSGKTLLFTGSWNSEVMVWDTSNDAMTLITSIDAHGGSVYALLVSNGRLFSGGGDNKIKIWEIDESSSSTILTSNPIANLKGRSGSIYSLAVADGKLFSASSSEIHVWNHPELKGKVFECPRK
jgi:WD40 repeat protein